MPRPYCACVLFAAAALRYQFRASIATPNGPGCRRATSGSTPSCSRPRSTRCARPTTSWSSTRPGARPTRRGSSTRTARCCGIRGSSPLATSGRPTIGCTCRWPSSGSAVWCSACSARCRSGSPSSRSTASTPARCCICWRRSTRRTPWDSHTSAPRSQPTPTSRSPTSRVCVMATSRFSFRPSGVAPIRRCASSRSSA